jgi:hypothetical protein
VQSTVFWNVTPYSLIVQRVALLKIVIFIAINARTSEQLNYILVVGPHRSKFNTYLMELVLVL